MKNKILLELMEDCIETFPAVKARYKYKGEVGINPAYTDSDHCSPICLNEKRIWALRGDLTLAVGIKNSGVSLGNTSLFFKTHPTMHSHIDKENRYGHPSLAVPEQGYDGSVYYAGWLYQHSDHIQIWMSSGRYVNNKLTQLQKELLEHYIAIKLMAAFGRQNIVFMSWEYTNEIDLFLQGELLSPEKVRRIYAERNIEQESLLSVFNYLSINKQLLLNYIPMILDGTFDNIHLAAQHGLLAIVRNLLNDHPERLNELDAYHQTPLVLAASNGQGDVVKYLIAQKANINLATIWPIEDVEHINKDNSTALDRAIMDGDAVVIALLLAAGAVANKDHTFINYKSIDKMIADANLEGIKILIKHNNNLLNQIQLSGHTLLQLAAISSQLEIVQFLIDEGAYLNTTTTTIFNSGLNEGFVCDASAMELALFNQDEDNEINDAIVVLLFEAGAKISPGLNGRLHVLHVVARLGLLPYVEMILNSNPELLNLFDGLNQTPLLWAASRGWKNVVDYLIAQGANVNFPTQCADNIKELVYCNNYSPLDWAIKYGHVDITTTLIKAGAISNHKHTAMNGKSVGDLITQNNLAAVKILIENNPLLINEPNKRGYTPLVIAIKLSQIDIVQLLIGFGADLNAERLMSCSVLGKSIKVTALELAIISDCSPIVALLLEAGAKTSAALDGHFHVIHFCSISGRLSRVKALLDYNPKLVNIVDDDNFTPFLYATRYKNHELVSYLISIGADQSTQDHLSPVSIGRGPS